VGGLLGGITGGGGAGGLLGGIGSSIAGGFCSKFKEVVSGFLPTLGNNGTAAAICISAVETLEKGSNGTVKADPVALGDKCYVGWGQHIKHHNTFKKSARFSIDLLPRRTCGKHAAGPQLSLPLSPSQ
jgi:hypothetical protein